MTTPNDSWRNHLHDEVFEVEGNDEEFRGQTCITDPSRPFTPYRHAWSRAEKHILVMLDIHYATRFAAAKYCREVADSITIKADRPKPPKFSWRGIAGKI